MPIDVCVYVCMSLIHLGAPCVATLGLCTHVAAAVGRLEGYLFFQHSLFSMHLDVHDGICI